jgi:hypothetical protein
MDNLVKLSVNLTEKNYQALNRASEMSADTRTDVVNRALAFYAFLYETAFLPGHQLLIRDRKTGEISEVRVDPFCDDRDYRTE